MNNKRLGTEFEREFCAKLADRGYWVHFLSPDNHGAQPFDIIAGKDGKIYAYDCKTSTKKVFPYSRLEENQKNAFELFIRRGNKSAFIAVKYESEIYLLPYNLLKCLGSIELTENFKL